MIDNVMVADSDSQPSSQRLRRSPPPGPPILSAPLLANQNKLRFATACIKHKFHAKEFSLKLYHLAQVSLKRGTLIESASKHQIAVRVDYERMLSWVGYDHQVLQREKMRYCMHKDDVVVGCSVPIRNNEPQRTNSQGLSVVTLADMQAPALNYLVALYHNSFTMADRDRFVEDVEQTIDKWVGNEGNVDLAKKQIQEMPEFYFVRAPEFRGQCRYRYDWGLEDCFKRGLFDPMRRRRAVVLGRGARVLQGRRAAASSRNRKSKRYPHKRRRGANLT
jgi:hypothetical protein